MNVILETERLLLREFNLSDASAFYELNADKEVMQHTGDTAFDSIEAAEELIRNYPDYTKNGFGRNTVVSKSTHEVLGWCGLKKHSNGLVDIGYRFMKKLWNQGYATESALACLGLGFKEYEIEEIIGNSSKMNPASIRVFEKLGMVFYREGNWDGLIDSVQYKITKRQWQELHSTEYHKK